MINYYLGRSYLFDLFLLICNVYDYFCYNVIQKSNIIIKFIIKLLKISNIKYIYKYSYTNIIN
jgi:hypothetical protein